MISTSRSFAYTLDDEKDFIANLGTGVYYDWFENTNKKPDRLKLLQSYRRALLKRTNNKLFDIQKAIKRVDYEIAKINKANNPITVV